MPLTDVQVRNAKPGPKPQKLFDGNGLFLHISPSGGKHWRLKYRFQGKEKLASFGAYPQVTLQDARRQREEALSLLAGGNDPAVRRKVRQVREKDAFEAIAREWHKRFGPRWAPKHAETILRRLEADVFSSIGGLPVAGVSAPQLLTVLRKVEARGAHETAHRLLQMCSQVFRYAIATGRAERDPAADLRGALAPAPSKHFASITEPQAVGALLRAIDGYVGSAVVSAALKLAPLTFVRPGELRAAEWAEFDLDRAEWRIPAARMKARTPHAVPLSTQALAILCELHKLTGAGRFLFPSIRTTSRPISNNTVNAALRRLGYGPEDMTGHGFRAMASTLLNGHGWDRDVIERQLAHGERNEVRAAYNFAEYLPERRKMMQWWADFLDELRAAKPVAGVATEGGR